MLADYVAFHASERPRALAVIDNGREITYDAFSRDIRKFTRALRALGLPPGSSAAIECRDFYSHWLLLLGFEQLGIATASFMGSEPAIYRPLLERTSIVLSSQQDVIASAKRHHAITASWLENIFALPDPGEEAAAPVAPDSPLRILSTSGTTGVPRRLHLSQRMFDAWVKRWIWCYGLTHSSRCLIVMPFVVGGIYAHATACIRSGGAVIWESRMPAERALATHAITHVTFLPIQLRQVIDRLPKGHRKAADLTISCFGASLSKALRDRAMNQFASEICDMYGCNEVGFISSTRRGDREFGSVWPGVRVEIVDEKNEPLPHGEMGRIRVQTESIFEGYLDDPEATSRMLRDGWFYPGDIGVLRAPRELQVVARSDELLNIGGLKVPPAKIEDQVLKKLPVRDVGVCSIRNADGIEEVWVAVSAEGGGASDGLLDRVKAAFGQGENANVHVIGLAHIPRNATGKIQRRLLKEAVLRETGLPVGDLS